MVLNWEISVYFVITGFFFQIIHFFNTPPNVSDSELHQVFNDYGVKAPIRIQKIPSRSEKSSSGFMEFTCLADAVAAIVSCNHAAIQSSG